MKTLEEILSEHIEGGYGAWMKLYDDIIKYRNEFAIEVAKEALKNAEDNATVTADWNNEIGDVIHSVNKESILSETNIPKL